MLLSDEEKRRFAEWCDQTAASNKGLAEQLKTSFQSPVMAQLAKKNNVEGMACEIVARMLRSAEVQTIGG